MDIIIFSDSHGRNDNIKKVLANFRHLDLAIHLGDYECYPETLRALFPCPLYMVKGNCDFTAGCFTSDVVPIQEHLAFITHGHRHHVDYTLDELRESARENGADIAMYGHTHRPVIDESDSQVLVLNPGSIQRPRQEGHRPSYIYMNVDEEGGLKPKIVYL